MTSWKSHSRSESHAQKQPILKITMTIIRRKNIPFFFFFFLRHPSETSQFSPHRRFEIWRPRDLALRVLVIISQSIFYIILITFTRNPTTKRISKTKLEIMRTPPPSGKYKQQLRTQATPDGPQSSSGSIWRRRQPTEKISSDAGKGSLPLHFLSLFFSFLGKGPFLSDCLIYFCHN